MPLAPAKTESFRLFDAIAGRYDFINSVLSLGLHRLWRRQLRFALPPNKPLEVLDLATGTGDVALELVRNPQVLRVQGIDLSRGMISEGQKKIQQKGLASKIQLTVGDAMRIPFEDASFDVVTMSFGIRNVPDAGACIQEIHRVLKPGGRCLIMEFGLPKQAVIRYLHLIYLRRILPLLGKLLSGHQVAYQYLNETIEDFPYGSQFLPWLHQCGFQQIEAKPLSLAIVYLYRGEKSR